MPEQFSEDEALAAAAAADATQAETAESEVNPVSSPEAPVSEPSSPEESAPLAESPEPESTEPSVTDLGDREATPEEDAFHAALLTLDPDDPDFEAKRAELVAFFEAEPADEEPEAPARPVSLPQVFENEEGTPVLDLDAPAETLAYPDAQKLGLQFDKPTSWPVESGYAEEARLETKSAPTQDVSLGNAIVPDNVGREDQKIHEDLARERDGV